jgi:predicted dehydrogenase
MRLLLCGFGSIGRRHFANARPIVPDATWTAVEPSRAAWRPEDGLEFVESLEAITGNFDVALICSPTHLHASQIEALAGRAAAFFIEKPLAHDRDSLATIRRALARNPVPTMVGCNYRFEPGLLRVRELLAADAIGKPLSARAEFGQWLPSWRPHTDYRQGYAARRATGGGIILDRIHELDYITWLLGTPRTVKALSGKLSDLEIETEDTADILLRFDGGAIASVHVDYLQREYVCSLKIVGERGSIAWRFKPTSVRLLRDTWETLHEDLQPDVNAMYVAELRHFFEAVAGGRSPINGVDEAARTCEIAFAALEDH